MAASASGQARVGVCEDGVRVHVKRVHKHTGQEKKKKKSEKKVKNRLTRNTDLHRPHGCRVCAWLW